MMIPRADIFDKTVGPQGKFSRFEAWFFLLSQAEIEEPNAGTIQISVREASEIFGWSKTTTHEFFKQLQEVDKLQIVRTASRTASDPDGVTYLITNFSTYSGVVSEVRTASETQIRTASDSVLNYPNKDLNNSSKKDLRSNLDGSKEREGGTGGEKNQSGASAPLAPDGAHGVSKSIKHKKGTPFTKVEQFPDHGSYLPVWLSAFQIWLDYRIEIKKPIRAANALKITFEKFQTGEALRLSVEQSIMNGWQGLFPARDLAAERQISVDVKVHQSSYQDRLDARIKALQEEEEKKRRKRPH